MNSSHNDGNNPLGNYFFHAVPRFIVQNLIFREMLDLKDIARLELAAAVHSIRRSQVSHLYLAVTHLLTDKLFVYLALQ
jgi:hypothetical protein